jgi:hypothetical protein
MKKLFFLFSFVSLIKAQDAYQYNVDLVNLENKRVKVELIPPTFNSDTITYCFPAVVPGTYEKYDFGRFIQDLKVVPKKNANVFLGTTFKS